MKDYQLIQDNELQGFLDAVNEKLNQGYIPIGGPHISEDAVEANKVWYAQAVAKPDSKINQTPGQSM